MMAKVSSLMSTLQAKGPFEKIISNVSLSCALEVCFQEGSKIAMWLRAALESVQGVPLVVCPV